METTQLSESKVDELVALVEEIIQEDKGRDEALRKISELLEAEVPVFDWVGFYLRDEEKERELVLGPYVGEPTEHTRIPFGKGICGQAAETEDTFVVQDVSEADNYLSCSIHVQAEIVVPVMKNDRFVAELDIDSHTRNSISEQHQQLCEQVCERVAELF
jgi:GAF domain-containing protein